jgi:dTMP kinase
MEAVTERVRGRELIRRGPYSRMFWSQLISSLGDWVTLFATFSLAARISGGGRGASVAILIPLVARILPGLIIGMVGGVIADRMDRKKLMVIADFGRAILVGALVFVGTYQSLFVLTFAIEVLSLLRQPAREAVIPQLIAERHLMAANGLNLIAAYATAPLGSALFALLAQLGRSLDLGRVVYPAVAAAFAFDAITFVLSGVIVLFTALPKPEIQPERQAAGTLDVKAPLRDMLDGFKFVTTFPAARRTVLGVALALFGAGALFVLGQPFSEQVLSGSDSGFGVLVTALGVGAATGMVVMTLNGKRIIRRELIFGLALFITGGTIGLTALANTVPGAAAWVLVAGAGSGVAYVSGFTHLHAVVTDDIRGRTFAALYAAARAALLISFALAGLGAAALEGQLPGLLGSGIRAVMLFAAVVIALAGAVVVWAVRGEILGDPFDEESYQALRDAGDAVTWMRGDRRTKPQ